jgi:hypothetical protein
MEKWLVDFFIKTWYKGQKVAIDKDITLTTLLWYQGENDGIEKTLGVSFGHKFATILQDVCTNLQCHDFPII